jgi:hydrogenase maturation factor
MNVIESGLVTELHDATLTATVETEQGSMEVDLRYLPGVLQGDVILFHSGIAFRVVGRDDTLTGASGSGSFASPR